MTGADKEREIDQTISAADLEPVDDLCHLVLLGAGASYAAFPNGDKNGKKLPLMNDFIETIGMAELADASGIPWRGRNFEEFYSELHQDDRRKDIRRNIECFVAEYFSSLELPDEPTIYDYLLLSLREKDVIATFNWDPFLFQAIHRNRQVSSPPQIYSLHGNVAIAYSFKEDGRLHINLVKEHDALLPSGYKLPPLLFPVTEKNYQTDPFISSQWESMKEALRHAYLFTIFGYGAPSTDVEAVKLMKEAWGDVNHRQFEQTEIIDIRDEDDLTSVWDPFIHTHHYDVHRSFFDSILARAPRRSVEATWAQDMEAEFVRDNPVHQSLTLTELQEWFRSLVDAEASSE